MGQRSELERLGVRLDALVAQHGKVRGLAQRFRKYRDDPVGFMTRELGMSLWRAQEQVAEFVAGHRLTRIRSAQGCGKTHVASGVVLWWLYCNGPSQVVTLAPTDRQIRELLWGEITARFLHGRDLPGELYTQALRVDAKSRHFAVGFAGTDAGRITGFHHERLLVVVDEAHGLEPWAWEAVFALVTGASNKVLAIGNPGLPSGKWFDVNRSDAWQGLTISALDHPNVVQGREAIPGAVSRQFVEDVRREYGEGSATYRSRVLGQYADADDDALCRRLWLELAAQRWQSKALEDQAAGQPLVFAVDPARFGPDHTALVVRQGPIVRDIVTWGKQDTMATVGRVLEEMDKRGVDRRQTRLVVDEIGLGGGVLDRLKENGARAEPFNAGRTARQDTKFQNRRAEGYWKLRRMLEEGTIALPRDEKLADELVAIRWRPTSKGLVQLEAKDDTRTRLGRSPDRADAVMMAFAGPDPLPVVDLGFNLSDAFVHPSPWRRDSIFGGDDAFRRGD